MQIQRAGPESDTMQPHSRPSRPSVRAFRAVAPLLVAASAGCAGVSVPTDTPDATDAEWRTLATPRPAPLPGAADVSIAEVQLTGGAGWPLPAGVSPELAVAELAGAGLLARRDVHYVERRRFTAAAEAERAGRTRPRGAPAAGVSPGADYLVTATWVSLGAAGGSIELRLSDARSGSVVASARVPVPERPDAVGLARAVVWGVLDALAEIDGLPDGEDPSAPGAGTTGERRISDGAVGAFLIGLEAEERWDWEGARRGYQAAAREEGFYEATAALARVARLRLGGTLGESRP